MTTDTTSLLTEKAKERKDGVYSHKGHLWVVKDNKFVAFSNILGYCYERIGSFNVCIGKVGRHDRKKKLNEWLKSKNSIH